MKTILVAALLLLAGTARADSIWDYSGNATMGASNVTLTGQPLYGGNPCQCALSGFVTLTAAGQVSSYSFTADGLTLTDQNSTAYINPDLNGANPNQPFYTWRINIQGANGSGIFSYFDGSTFEATDAAVVPGSSGMFEEGNKGSWVDPVSAPEPGTFALLGFGLAVLSLMSFRVKA